MRQSFILVLAITISFLSVVPITTRSTKRNRLLLTQDERMPEEGGSDSRLPSINVNIIVVPIIREPSVGEKDLINYNNNGPFPQRGKLKSTTTASTNRPNIEDSFNYFLEDLDTMASSNQIYFPDRSDLDPALGIISPQLERMMCKVSEVYDKRLGQCIKRNPGSCPLCRRGR